MSKKDIDIFKPVHKSKFATIIDAQLLELLKYKCKKHDIKINAAIEYGIRVFLDKEIKK